MSEEYTVIIMSPGEPNSLVHKSDNRMLATRIAQAYANHAIDRAQQVNVYDYEGHINSTWVAPEAPIDAYEGQLR